MRVGRRHAVPVPYDAMDRRGISNRFDFNDSRYAFRIDIYS